MRRATQTASESATASAISPDHSASLPSRTESCPAAAPDHARQKDEDKLHGRGLQNQQQDKQPEQLGEDL